LDRDKKRIEKTVAHLWTHLDEVMRNELGGVGLWVDNSQMNLEDTVEYILSHKAKAVTG
jgi:hypothetical protein